MSTHVCIDPGAKGGYVIRFGDGKIVSGKLADIMDEMDIIRAQPDVLVVIEKVPPFVGRMIPSSASFKLGYSFGWCVGIMSPFRTVLVRPQDWQATVGVGTRGKMTTTQWKNKLKDEARRLFPQQASDGSITLDTADAFLLLEHAMRERF